MYILLLGMCKINPFAFAFDEAFKPKCVGEYMI